MRRPQWTSLTLAGKATHGTATGASLVVWLAVVMFAPLAFAQVEEQAVGLFEKRVAVFEKFFADKPMFLAEDSFRDSPTGFIFTYQRLLDPTVSYDVRKTDSVISPYMGYVTVKFTPKSSRNCGSLRPKFEEVLGRFFVNVEEARQSKDDESCYAFLGTARAFTVRFVFAFQKQQWVFKDIENVGDHAWSNILWPVLGKTVGTRLTVEDNDRWLTLIK